MCKNPQNVGKIHQMWENPQLWEISPKYEKITNIWETHRNVKKSPKSERNPQNVTKATECI